MFIPGFLISIVTFPGVVVHELAHVAFCKFTDSRVLKICYFRFGNPAGYVLHEQPSSVWRHILIGIGPFFVNTLIGFIIGILAIPFHINSDQPSVVQLFLLWLGVSIAMHSFPSTGDARSIWRAVWSQGAPLSARLIASPLVVVIFVGAIGSIVWLDALYGIAVVGTAGALQKASQHIGAQTMSSNNVESGANAAASPTASTFLSPDEQFVLTFSRNLNSRLPMQADRETRLDTTVPGPGRRFTYIYTYLGNANLDQETIAARLRLSMINGYKTSPDMAGFRSHDVEIHYVYRDKSGRHLGEVVVSPSDF